MRINLLAGDIVVTSTKGGNVRKAKVTDLIKGVVFLPMHWGKQLDNDLNRTNNVTNTIVDPV
jgi:ferredoxin-nitrate reductase